jgi:DNA-directed RNA polymerase subunit N (RpoN/RPB10)
MIKENEFYIHKLGCTIVQLTAEREYHYTRDYYTWYITYISNDEKYSLYSRDVGKTERIYHWNLLAFDNYYIPLDKYEEFKQTEEYEKYLRRLKRKDDVNNILDDVDTREYLYRKKISLDSETLETILKGEDEIE